MPSRSLFGMIAKIAIAALLFADQTRARPNFIVVQPDDFYFFEEWNPPAQFDGGNSLEQFPQNWKLPNINRIRQEGLQMTNAYAASSMCGTSRYSTITGRYPSRSAYGRLQDKNDVLRNVRIPATKLEDVNGVTDSKDCSENNIAALLKRHGYKTGVTGKWHLTSDDGGAYTYSRIQNDIRGCGFDFAEAIYKENMWGDWYGDATHNMEHLTSEAFKFIEEAVEEEDKPFFLYFNPTVPHGSRDVIGALENADCRDTVGGRLSSLPSIRYGMTADYGGNCEAYRQSVLERGGRNDDKLAGAVWVDDAIGSLIQLLENLGVMDNTFFLFQLDHGENTKGSLFEGGTRIPQFIHYPNLFRGASTFEGLVSTIDVAATIADIAGVPASDRYPMDGKSWKQEIVNRNSKWSAGNDRCLFTEEGLDRSVRCGCHKYMLVENPNNGQGFTVREARQVGISVSNNNFYNLCDSSGSYINAPEVSPEKRSADMTDFLKSELEAKVDCHLSRTKPSNDPKYDQKCDEALDSFDNPTPAVPTWPPIPAIPSPTYTPTRSPVKAAVEDEIANPSADDLPWADNRKTSAPTRTATPKPTKVPTVPTHKPTAEPSTPLPSQEPTKMPTIRPIPISDYVTEPPTDSPLGFDFFNSTDDFDDFNETDWNGVSIIRLEDSICFDDSDYFYLGVEGQDCQWVIKNDRCDREDPETQVHIGKVFCPKSCSYCEADDDCVDNPLYQWYGQEGVGCTWLASSGRCESVRDAVGDSSVHLGKHYCPKSCGYCPDEELEVDPAGLDIDIEAIHKIGSL